MAEGLEWLPEDGVVLTRIDLERIFGDLRALIRGTDSMDPNRAFAVDIAIAITPGPRTRHWRRLMPRPKAIQWLEDQTGQHIDYPTEAPAAQDRHLSVRLSRELAIALDAMAAERRVTVSQLVRELLTDVVSQRSSVSALDGRALAERLAADVAEVRRRLAG